MQPAIKQKDTFVTIRSSKCWALCSAKDLFFQHVNHSLRIATYIEGHTFPQRADLNTLGGRWSDIIHSRGLL
jgi:hypothetical protein